MQMYDKVHPMASLTPGKCPYWIGRWMSSKFRLDPALGENNPFPAGNPISIFEPEANLFNPLKPSGYYMYHMI
jgi:hypothetical protein